MANGVITWLAPILAALMTCAGQLWLNQRFKWADQKRDDARKSTEAKRAAEAEWRSGIETRLDQQDAKIESVLKGQCTQMRSDILHKAHRYVDDLGCASTEEKESLWAEYEDYSAVCDANNITNHFIDKLVNQVMQLPNRGEK